MILCNQFSCHKFRDIECLMGFHQKKHTSPTFQSVLPCALHAIQGCRIYIPFAPSTDWQDRLTEYSSYTFVAGGISPQLPSNNLTQNTRNSCVLEPRNSSSTPSSRFSQILFAQNSKINSSKIHRVAGDALN